MEKIVIITGTTATGKTDLSIELAKQTNGEIISADSMMVYKYMDIGTAKPSLEERKGIPHYLIDVVYPDENFSVKDFLNYADKKIANIRKKGKIPIVVGGTWLYIQALIYGLSDAPEGNWEIRKKLYQENNSQLYEKLRKVDPQYAQKIHPNDKKRIIRALEVFLQTGKPFSKFQKEHSFKNKRYDFIGFNITRNKEDIMKRIEVRVNKMIKKGLVDEVKFLIEKGYYKAVTSKQAIGYKELIPYFEGKKTLNECVLDIIKNTRTFAKRQIRVFNKKEEFIPVNLSNTSYTKALGNIKNIIKKEVLL